MTAKQLVTALAFGSVLPLLAACPKKQVAVEEEAAAPPAPVVIEASVLDLVPEVEDAGADADAADGAPKPKGVAINPTVANLKRCCSAIRSQATALGASPEAATLKTIAAQCDALAAQVGPSGNAPELAPLRQMLKLGKGIPPVCSSL